VFKSVSVIIPTYQRQSKLAECLASLARQGLPAGVSMEVVVAIDAGADDECPVIAAAPVHTRFIRLPRNGAAAARNSAIELARGELLVFFNDDTYLAPDCITEHFRAQEMRGEPGMVVGQTQWLARPNPTVFDGLVRDTSMVFFYDGMRAGQMYGFRHFWTCNASAPAELIRSVGGFEKRLRPVFFEDCELGFRLERATGTGVYYPPAAENVHDHAMTWDEYRARERRLGEMAVRLARANPECFSAIYGTSDVVALARRFAEALELDRGDRNRAERELGRWVNRPLHEVRDWASMKQMLYLLHLPIKRALFREAFLMELERGEVEMSHPVLQREMSL